MYFISFVIGNLGSMVNSSLENKNMIKNLFFTKKNENDSGIYHGFHLIKSIEEFKIGFFKDKKYKKAQE